LVNEMATLAYLMLTLSGTPKIPRFWPAPPEVRDNSMNDRGEPSDGELKARKSSRVCALESLEIDIGETVD
jgi:hypothetical protein